MNRSIVLPFQIVERKKEINVEQQNSTIRGRQDTLSAARLIDNAVEISFARANLGSQMRRLRARCKRNRPLPRRDGANLLPLGMKADLSTPPLIAFFLLLAHPRVHTPPSRPFLLLIPLSTRIEGWN